MAKILINYGANVNVKDSEGTAPIVCAIQNNDIEMTELLLRNGANIEEDHVVLRAGAQRGRENLLKSGASEKMVNSLYFRESLTLLQIAVDGKQLQMVKLLIKYGANVNVRECQGEIPIVYAIQNNDTEMVELLLSNGTDIKNDPKILCTAVRDGRLKIVEVLLKYGADVNMIDNSDFRGSTPLHHAVQRKQVQMAKMLINNGANVNVRECQVEIPIIYAIRNNDTEMIELLLSNGTNIKKDPKVLCTATRDGSLKIVEILLKYGANVNVVDNSDFRGSTPLHYAVQRKHVQMAKVLINNGANVNVADGSGTTPTAYAIQYRDSEMIELLVTNGVDVKNNPNLLRYAVESRSLTIIENLLKYGADVNASDQYGTTALHYAVLHLMVHQCQCRLKYCFKQNYSRYDSHHRTCYDRRCMKKIVELLLSKGANVNVETESGMTTLFAASRNGYKEIVEILLKYGAECDPGAGEDVKPLHAAAVGGHLEIVENLLKFGAEVNSRDKYGRTALHLAFRGRYKQIVRILLEYGSDVNIISIKNHTPLEHGRLVVDFANCNKDDYDYYVHNRNDSHGYTNDSPSTKLVKQHIAKMKAAGLHISERNLLGIGNDHEINHFLNECEAEIEIMKSEKIDNTCVSFYDILTKNISQLVKNESIVEALKSNDYETKFPIYASMIDSRFRRGVKREKLLEQVRKKLLHSLLSLTELPLLCTDKIFSYLSDKDLKIVLVA